MTFAFHSDYCVRSDMAVWRVLRCLLESRFLLESAFLRFL